jgi:hypothetical protein
MQDLSLDGFIGFSKFCRIRMIHFVSFVAFLFCSTTFQIVSNQTMKVNKASGASEQRAGATPVLAKRFWM